MGTVVTYLPKTFVWNNLNFLVFVDLVERINTQLNRHETGRLFAVVHIQGLQRKVTNEDILVYRGHLEADPGERITLNKVSDQGGHLLGLLILAASHLCAVKDS